MCGVNTGEQQRIGQRLKEARKKAGFRSARAAAEMLGIPEQTVRSHEGGWRGFDDETAKRYARRYGAKWMWILYGDQGARAQVDPPPRPGEVRLAGYIGAGSEIFPLEGDHELIEAPPGITDRGIALIVRGESQLPVYGPGDIVFCEQKREGTALRDLVGLTCAVQVHEGPFLLKTLMPGTKKGVWTLLSHNADPVLDQRIEWAAFAEWHRVARRRWR